MDTPKQQSVWANLVKATTVHQGHGNKGQGSAISRAAVEYWSNTYHKMMSEVKATALQKEGDQTDTKK